MKITIGATPDDDRRTLERFASDDLLAVVTEQDLQTPVWQDLLARARHFVPKGQTNFARSALSTFRLSDLDPVEASRRRAIEIGQRRRG